MSEALAAGPISDESPGTYRDYSDAEIELAFGMLAYYSGNLRRTARAIEESGGLGEEKRTPDHTTLRNWRNRMPERYERVRQEILPKIRDELAERHTDLAAAQIEASMTATGELARRLGDKDELEKITATQLASVIGKLDVGTGIHTQRASELRGEGVVVRHEHRSFQQIRDSLAARGIEVEVIQGTASEVPPDQLPPPEPVQPPEDEPTPEEAKDG